MPSTVVQEVVADVVAAQTWNERIMAIRRVPEQLGQPDQALAYSRIAKALYSPQLVGQFAYVPWPGEYSWETFAAAYAEAESRTLGFTVTSYSTLMESIREVPETLRVFRLVLGYSVGELAEAVSVGRRRVQPASTGISKSAIESIEAGRAPTEEVATLIAKAIDEIVRGEFWAIPPAGFASKMAKVDTDRGWHSVAESARDGVPYAALLHQRHFGGPFRTLLDATSEQRGDLLEEPLEQLLSAHGFVFIRTGSSNQHEVSIRFGLTISPAPDFVVYEPPATLLAIIECKHASDGGTARDKASRFDRLRNEGSRLGGVPLFALLDGIGWRRTGDALGPVVRATDGRVFTLLTLNQMLDVPLFSEHIRQG